MNKQLKEIQYLVNELLKFSEGHSFDQEYIKSFKGFGAYKDVFLSSTTLLWELQEPFNKLGKLIDVEGEKVWSMMQESCLTSFYTDPSLIETICSNLKGHPGMKILDPSAGTGRFMEALNQKFKSPNIDQLEINPITYLMNKASFNNEINITKTAFENHSIDNKYDLIISNIPFGDIPVSYDAYRKTQNSRFTKQIDSFFFAKSLDHLKDGGIISFITSSSLMDNNSRKEIREHIVKNSDIIDCYRLPNDAFKKEGTAVVTDLIILRKNSSKKQLTKADDFFINTTSIDVDGQECNLNSYYRNYKPDNILGQATIGYFHGRKGLTFKSNPDINTVTNLKEKLSQYEIELNSSKTIIRKPLEVNDYEKRQLKFYETINTCAVNSKRDFAQFHKLLKEHAIQMNATFQRKGKQLKSISFTGISSANIDLSCSLQEMGTNLGSFIMNNFDKNITPFYNQNRKEQDKQTNDLFAAKTERDSVPGNAQLDIFSALAEDKNEEQKTEKKEIDKELIAKNSKKELSKRILHHYDNILEQDRVGADSSFHRGRLLDELKKFQTHYGDSNSKINIEFFEANFSDRAYTLATLNPKSEITQKKESRKLNTIEEAYNLSIAERGKIDINFISQHYQNQDHDTIIKDLIDDKLGYLDPLNSNNVIESTEYISGNLSEKIDQAEQSLYNAREPWIKEQYSRNIDDLKSSLPNIIKIKDIYINLGSTWVDNEIYKDFLKDKYGIDVKIGFIKSTDSYEFKLNPSDSYSMDKIWKVATFNYAKILSKSFGQEYPLVTYKNIDGKIRTNHEATRKLHLKIETIQKDWQDYYKASVHNEYLERKYNKLFNSTKQRNINSIPYRFSPIEKFKPYTHQEEGAKMVILNEGGVIDHSVGAGKTLTMSMISNELIRLKKSDKVFILALKSTIGDIGHDFKTAYPNAPIYITEEKDFAGEANRKKMIAKIQSYEKGIFVMTHEQFGKIPQDPKQLISFIQEELDALEYDLKYANEHPGKVSKMAIKGLKKRQISYQVKLEDTHANMKKDSGIPNFSELGVNHIIIDESHKFKNIPFATKHTQVAGIGNPVGSQRALNMLIAAKTLHSIHGKDKGISLVSGTQITNSPIELYNILRVVMPSQLSYNGTKTLDGFVKAYAKKSVDYEFTITGEIKKKERLREYTNIPELSAMYGSITDIRNENNLKLDKPKLNTHLITVKPTPDQIAFNKKLVQLANSNSVIEIKNVMGNIIGRDIPDGYKKAKMLVATNLAKQMSLDLKLVNPELYCDSVSPKLVAVRDKVYEKYQMSMENKGTQFIFCDIGTPKKDEYNVYDELKGMLMDSGIPEHEITFIHHHNTKKRRKALFSEVNKGNIRCILGSTEKMGTGVNMQKKACAMHHLDIPWKPADVDQRDGRGARQGNDYAKMFMDNKIPSYFYATERTLDAYQFELLNLKKTFIEQIKNNTVATRSIKETSDDGQMDYAEYVAALTGNDDLLQLSKAEQKISTLESAKKTFFNDIDDLKLELEKAKNSIESNKKNAELFIKEETALKANFKENIPDQEFPLKFDSSEITSAKNFEKTMEMGEALIDLSTKVKGNPNILDKRYNVMNYGGYELSLTKEKGRAYISLYSSHTKLFYGKTELDQESSALSAGMFFKRELSKIEKRPKEQLVKLDASKETFEKIKTQYNGMSKVFEGEEELKTLKQRAEDIRGMLDRGNQKAASIKM